MKKDFWLERWDRDEIGFHQNEINPYLLQYWEKLGARAGDAVFVPLSGKSLDMLWLRDQGHPVLGVELSPVAVSAFFEENKLAAEIIKHEQFDQYTANEIHILCGDFFDLSAAEMAQVNAVYDRASLVALPPEMRERYARQLMDMLPAGTAILLIAFDYPQEQMPGPPFAVSVSEVETLYSQYAEIQLLAQKDALAENPRFQQRGIERLQENIFLLKRR